MTEDVVEACHNNIVSWERPSPVQPILIRGAGDYHKTKQRWEILKEYFVLNNIEFREITSLEGSILSKLINLIYLLDYATPATRQIGEKLIAETLANMESHSAHKAQILLAKLRRGERDVFC